MSTGSKWAGWRRIAVCLTLGLLLAGCSGKNTYNRDYDKLPKGSYTGKSYTVKRAIRCTTLPGSPTAKSAIWPESTRYARLIASKWGRNCGRAAAHRPKPPPRAVKPLLLPPRSPNKRRRRALPAVGVGRPAAGSCRPTPIQMVATRASTSPANAASRSTLPPRAKWCTSATSCAATAT